MNDPKRPIDEDSARLWIEQTLANTPGILGIEEFRRFPSPIQLFPGEPEILLHDFAAVSDYTDEIAWLRHVLAVEQVSGTFYLLYEESIPRPALWARVILSSEFEWVEPLWNLGKGLYFLPTDVSYFLEVMLEEGIPRVFRRGKRL